MITFTSLYSIIQLSTSKKSPSGRPWCELTNAMYEFSNQKTHLHYKRQKKEASQKFGELMKSL